MFDFFSIISKEFQIILCLDTGSISSSGDTEKSLCANEFLISDYLKSRMLLEVYLPQSRYSVYRVNPTEVFPNIVSAEK